MNHNASITIKEAITVLAIEKLKRNQDNLFEYLRETERIYLELFIGNQNQSSTIREDVKQFYQDLGFKISKSNLMNYQISIEEEIK